MNDGIKITTFENGLYIKIFGELDSFHVMGYKEKIINVFIHLLFFSFYSALHILYYFFSCYSNFAF